MWKLNLFLPFPCVYRVDLFPCCTQTSWQKKDAYKQRQGAYKQQQGAYKKQQGGEGFEQAAALQHDLFEPC